MRHIALPKRWRDHLVDDALGGQIGHRTLERLGRRNAQTPIVQGHHQQQAVAHLAATDLPGIAQALGEVGNVFGGGAGHHKHHDLGAASLLKRLQLLLQSGHIGGRQGAGLVHHAGREGRHGHECLTPSGHQAQSGTSHHPQQQPCQALGQAMRGRSAQCQVVRHAEPAHLPKSTLGGALMAASLATAKLGLGA
jgi:hypothetical protein